MERCRLCGYVLCFWEKKIDTPEGRVHKSCQLKENERLRKEKRNIQAKERRSKKKNTPQQTETVTTTESGLQPTMPKAITGESTIQTTQGELQRSETVKSESTPDASNSSKEEKGLL
jgi:hypothetical protein